MKYFLIAGEASGDLHGSHLISALRGEDPEAEFQFLGGDLMAGAAGVQPIIHYRRMAYMGFLEVARHLREILGFMRTAREAISRFQPDAVVLIDYPSFNLKIARFAHDRGIPVHYFISPKVWVWKQWRVKDIRRYVSRMYCILPFEPDWYARHDYRATYVGNPTAEEITHALASMPDRDDFLSAHGLDPDRPLIALVPGSRVKEIRDNLPTMLAAARAFSDHQLAVAAAPNINSDIYADILAGTNVTVIDNATWTLVRHARVAIVTSGTATLETALLGTPQIACYRMGGSKWLYRFYRRLLKGNYVTLPNLIADAPIIPELLMYHCSEENIATHLDELLPDTSVRQAQLNGYATVTRLLGDTPCAPTAAKQITRNISAKS